MLYEPSPPTSYEMSWFVWPQLIAVPPTLRMSPPQKIKIFTKKSNKKRHHGLR